MRRRQRLPMLVIVRYVNRVDQVKQRGSNRQQVNPQAAAREERLLQLQLDHGGQLTASSGFLPAAD